MGDHVEASSKIGVLLAVNVGEPRTVRWMDRDVVTAIWKTPVEGRVAVAGINIAGDRQADRRVHGGPDKAVYVYATDDYRWWETELAAPIAPGTFGENLTVEGIDLAAAVVGEVWSIGTAAFRVTEPRMPCFKLGIRMGDATFVDRFAEARRFGVYLTNGTAGDIGAGDPIELVSRPRHGVTASVISEAHETQDPSALRLLVETGDIPEGWQIWAARQLARGNRRRGV